MKNAPKIVTLSFLGLFSFGFFLYLSFPYGVLKEALANQVQLATGMKVRIDDLGPAIPFGFSATGVEVNGNGGAKVALSKVKVTISLLKLLILKLGVAIEVYADSKGYLELDLGFPLIKLISSQDFTPSGVGLEAKAFPLDAIASYGLKQFASSEAAGALAGPIIGALGFRGTLDGDLDLNIDASAFSQSTGKVKLKFTNTALILSDPSIGLPDQVFSSAQIQADLANAAFKIDPSSRFVAHDLELGVDGKIILKNMFYSSDLDLKLLVKLAGDLQDKFGWVMDGLSGGASKGGQLNLQVRGSVAAPVTPSL